MNSIVSINKEEDISKITKETKYINIPIDIVNNNINNYFLCRVNSFGDKNLTEDEINCFHLSTLKLSYEDAVKYFGRKADKNRKIYNGMLKTYFYSFMGPKPPKRG